MPSAEAVAVLGEDILHVGTDEETLALAGPETKLIDLEGRALMPGFVDPHNHLLHLKPDLGITSLDDAQQQLLEFGITMVADPATGPAGFWDGLLAYANEGNLRVRTSVYFAYNHHCGSPHAEGWYSEFPQVLDTDSMLRTPGIKIWSDGGTCNILAMSVDIPEELLQQESNDDPITFPYFTSDELAVIIRDLQETGYQVAIHAIGDRAVETVLNAYEAALEGQPNTYRHRIDHNQYIRPELLSRYGELGILPVVFGNPNTCLIVNGTGTVVPLGEVVYPWFRPYRSLIDANPGLRIAWHGDWGPTPVRQVSVDLAWLVTRKEFRSDGTFCEPPDWLAAEAITMEEALQWMTINGAYALFMDDEIGSLKAGKFADLVVLSDNPLTIDPGRIIELEVLMTIVGGRVEYCGQEDLCTATR